MRFSTFYPPTAHISVAGVCSVRFRSLPLVKSVRSETSPIEHADVRRAEVLFEDGELGRTIQPERGGGAAVPPSKGTFSTLAAEADEFRRWE